MKAFRTKSIAMLAIGILVAASGFAHAQTQSAYELRHQIVETERQAIITSSLPLTDNEASSFWPLYAKYREEIKETDDRRLELLQHFSEHMQNLDSKEADYLVSNANELDVDRQKIKRKYFDRFSRIISGAKLFRFYQIETKLEAIHRVNWTQQVPLAAPDEEFDAPIFEINE